MTDAVAVFRASFVSYSACLGFSRFLNGRGISHAVQGMSVISSDDRAREALRDWINRPPVRVVNPRKSTAKALVRMNGERD